MVNTKCCLYLIQATLLVLSHGILAVRYCSARSAHHIKHDGNSDNGQTIKLNECFSMCYIIAKLGISVV